MELSPQVSPNGARQLQPQRPPIRRQSTQEVMIHSPPAPSLASVWIQQRCSCSSCHRGPHTHPLPHAYKSKPHILVSLIKHCVWWWKLGCDERVCGAQRCTVNASEHWISPVLLIRAQQGRIKDPDSCVSPVWFHWVCQWWRVTKYMQQSTSNTKSLHQVGVVELWCLGFFFFFHVEYRRPTCTCSHICCMSGDVFPPLWQQRCIATMFSTLKICSDYQKSEFTHAFIHQY